jgi:hypothetical protein
MGIEYSVIADRLTPAAEALLLEMVDRHLAASETIKRIFIASETFSGATLLFGGEAVGGRNKLDIAALNDLADYGLLRTVLRKTGTTLYEVSGETLAFVKWLRSYRGGPMAALEHETRRLADGDEFAVRNATAAHHLREALALLDTADPTRLEVASELGNHLRSALIDVAQVVTGATIDVEKAGDHLTTWAATQSARRDAKVLASFVQLAADVQRLNQRLTHARDEAGKNEPPISWGELRRATLVTSLCCHELDIYGAS